jgi:hypothetical protein
VSGLSERFVGPKNDNQVEIPQLANEIGWPTCSEVMIVPTQLVASQLNMHGAKCFCQSSRAKK